MKQRKVKLRDKNIYLLLILFLAAIIYFNTLQNDFTNWDDDTLILYNYRIQDLNLEKFEKILTTPTATDYLPLKELSYALDYYFWKLDPFGFHLSNLILFVLNCLLVYLIFDFIFKDKFISFLGAIVFTVHPIHVESVAWLSGRKDLLSGLFFFLSFYFYLKNRNLFALPSFILALLSKPTVIILPLLLVLYELTLNGAERNWKKIFLRVFPFFLIAAVSGFITLRVGFEKGVVKTHIGETFLENLMLMSGVFFDYIKLVFLPINLCAHYTIPINIAPNAVKFLFLFFLLLLILSMRKTGFDSQTKFFLIWPVITILPISYIIPISILKADRYLYLPSITFAAFAAILFHKLYNRSSKLKPLVIIIPLLLLFSILTVERNKIWKNSITLMEDTVKKSPGFFIAYNNLGIAYSNAKLYNKAFNSYRKALEINPYFAKAHANIGTLYATVGNYQKGLVEIKAALKLDPFISDVQFNLGLLYYKIGLLDEAIIHYEKASRLAPEHERFRRALIKAKQEKEQIIKEIANPEKAKMIKMKISDSYNNLGIMEFTENMIGEAEIAFKKALLFNPENKMAKLNLANIYFLNKEYDKSITEYENVIKSNPKIYKAYWNLGLIYKAKGDKVMAFKTFKKILEAEPDNRAVLNEIESLKR